MTKEATLIMNRPAFWLRRPEGDGGCMFAWQGGLSSADRVRMMAWSVSSKLEARNRIIGGVLAVWMGFVLYAN